VLFAMNLRRLRNQKEVAHLQMLFRHLSDGISNDYCLLQTQNNPGKEFQVILSCKAPMGKFRQKLR
jgi:hypothetical protein